MLVETFNEHHGCFVIYSHRVTNTERAPAAKKARAIPTTPLRFCLVHCDCNSRPQDELEDWSLIRQTFSKCNPFLEGTWKSIQGLGTGQFLKCFRLRGQGYESSQLTTSASSLQLLLPASPLEISC